MFCDKDKIPPFVNGTGEGAIDWKERQEGNPERWNAYGGRLTYTCPLGFVLEKTGQHAEQQDPIPLHPEEFEVDCSEDATWRPVLGAMPSCIRKIPP